MEVFQGGSTRWRLTRALCSHTRTLSGRYDNRTEPCRQPHHSQQQCVCVQVKAADSVLVIGGGSTGVEMAAEIRTEYPDKKVGRDYGNL